MWVLVPQCDQGREDEHVAHRRGGDGERDHHGEEVRQVSPRDQEREQDERGADHPRHEVDRDGVPELANLPIHDGAAPSSAAMACSQDPKAAGNRTARPPTAAHLCGARSASMWKHRIPPGRPEPTVPMTALTEGAKADRLQECRRNQWVQQRGRRGSRPPRGTRRRKSPQPLPWVNAPRSGSWKSRSRGPAASGSGACGTGSA